MLSEETAQVLLFRDAALRRPIDVVAFMNATAPLTLVSNQTPDNVVPLPLGRFVPSQGRARRRRWHAGPPAGGEAA